MPPFAMSHRVAVSPKIRPFRLLKTSGQSVVYVSGSNVAKFFYDNFGLREDFRLAVHRHPLLGPLLRTGNRLAQDNALWSFAKQQVRRALFPFVGSRDYVTPTQALEGYRLVLERAPHLMIPTRIVPRTALPIQDSL